MTFTSAFCSTWAIYCSEGSTRSAFHLFPCNETQPWYPHCHSFTAGHHTPSHAIPQISMYRVIPYSTYGSMQAQYMIFWETDPQLTHILVDTEPLSQVLHTSCTFVLLQHRRVSTAGTAWPTLWPQREHGAGHLQEMGRREFTHPGREPSVITAGSSFPFLREKDTFFQLGKCPKSQHLKGAPSLI